jgi:hypothetical protein
LSVSPSDIRFGVRAAEHGREDRGERDQREHRQTPDGDGIVQQPPERVLARGDREGDVV